MTAVDAGVRLRDLDGAGFAPYNDRCVEIYLAAMDRPRGIAAVRRDATARHVTYAGFRAVVAVATGPLTGTAGGDGAAGPVTGPVTGPVSGTAGGGGEQVVGFAYAYPGAPGQWWHDLVAPALRRRYGVAPAERWLADSLELVELHVDPPHQGRGIGRRLLRRVAGGTPASTLLLSAVDADTPARRLYRSVGFVDLLRGFTFPGTAERYAIMAAELPLARPGAGPR